jgi:peptidoglycan/LPS O-acetylase OafA/YrhL
LLDSEPPPQTEQRLQALDVLRALAVVLLILHHGGIYNFSFLGFDLKQLRSFVGLYLLGSFVFLAGCLSMRSVEGLGIRRFLAKRLVRIYVPYVITLLLFLWLLEPDLAGSDLILHLLGAQVLLAPKFTTPILTLWFIGLILLCYVILALLGRALKRPASILLGSLAVFLAAGMLREYVGIIHHTFFYYFPAYAAGAILAQAGLLERMTRQPTHLLPFAVLSALGVVLLSPHLPRLGRTVDVGMIVAISVFLAGAIPFTLALASRVVAYGIGLRLIQRLSYSAFFAYLLHRPIWAVCLALYTPESRELLSVWQLLSGFGLVLPTAYFAQKLFDRLLRKTSSGSDSLSTPSGGPPEARRLPGDADASSPGGTNSTGR